MLLFTVPLALIGVVFGLLVTGQSFNVMSLIGLVVLVGIVVNDAIVKVDFYQPRAPAGTALRQAILLAGQKRLRPILMTTITTVLGLLPMAMGFGEGAELRRPLAIAIIFGLTFATVLTLIVVPVGYQSVQGRRGG
ncbi:MAG: efflux RND transporter permease subunit [candidate division KSB1 bacterium]|nr:efflux RND transporter permease subunit [candidate division KSB1 bacterium]